MKNILARSAVTLAVALSLSAPAALAKHRKPKHSAEHVAAVKKCNADYKAALAAANKLKGKERRDSRAKAKSDHRQCLANAPKP